MSINIWIFNHYATDTYKDHGGRHYWFAENLIKKGYHPTIFCANTIHNSNEIINTYNRIFCIDIANNIPYVFVRTNSYSGNGKQRIKNMIVFFKNLFPVAKEYEKLYGKPDVIFASSVHPLTLVAGIQIAKRLNIPCICEIRDLWPETLVAMDKVKKNSIAAKLLYNLEKFIYKKADKLIFTFPGGKDYLESIGLDTSKARYINNGVDLEEFNENRTKYVFNDKDLEDENMFKIVFAGAIGKANAINRIIDAAEILIHKNVKNINFIIFGDGPEKIKLKKHLKNNNITNVIFKEKVEKKYIPGILEKTDLNIFCLEHLPNLFKYGLSPNKMFEYFASGKPIISNVECGYDMLKKYNCGITVQGGSAEALAEGILKFYNMPKEEYDTYCQNALKAAQDFDFKILTDKLEKVILED